MPEVASEKAWIYASPEVLAEMMLGWSKPVEVHAERNPDGSWEMSFRAVYNERGEQIARPIEMNSKQS